MNMVCYRGYKFESRDEVMDFIRKNATKYDIINAMSGDLYARDFYNAYEKAKGTTHPQKTFWNWMTDKIDGALCEYIEYEMDNCCVEEKEND